MKMEISREVVYFKDQKATWKLIFDQYCPQQKEPQAGDNIFLNDENGAYQAQWLQAKLNICVMIS